jgi:hypothetical protein
MIINDQKIYDGSFIHQRFAYKYFRDKTIPTGNIVAFRAPARVTDNLIDLEDALDKDYIFSTDMIHFCWEKPSIDLWGGVAFQRLFNTYIGDILGSITQKQVEICNDDIFVKEEFIQGGITQLRGKASVSIACERNGAVLCHTGINICAGKEAPAFAYSTNMNNMQIEEFIKTVIQQFYNATQSIFIATTKVIS